MKGQFLQNIVMAGAILLSPLGLYAQAPSNTFEKLDYNARYNINQSTLGNSYSNDPNSRRYENSPEAYRAVRSGSALCRGGSCPVETDEEKAANQLQPSKKHHAINMYGPMAGFADTMYSQMQTNQLGTILSSPMVLYNSTMMLTEPAVAAAVQNSAMFGLNSIQARYMAESTFLQGLDGQPDTKEMVLRAYNECIAEFMRQRGRGVGATDSPNDQSTWIAAQSECMSDRIKNVQEVHGGQNFNDFKYSTLGADGTGIGFDFLFDPSHPAFWSAAGLTPGSQNYILLSDYLFNESNWEELGYPFDVIENLKRDFQSLLGDYEFWFDENQPTSSNDKRSSSREIKYRKLAPPVSFQQWVDAKYFTAYEGIMNMVKAQCEFNPGLGGQPFQDSNIACTKNGRVGSDDKFVTLSTNGYQFDCAMVAMLLNRFRADFPEVKQGDCAVLDPAGQSAIGSLWGRQRDVKSGHRAASFLATRIALGQAYATLMQIDQITSSTTSQGGFETFAKRYATQLIFSAVGSRDYMADYSRIINSINNEFRPEIQALTGKEVGKGAEKFTEAARVETQQGTKAMNGQ